MVALANASMDVLFSSPFDRPACTRRRGGSRYSGFIDIMRVNCALRLHRRNKSPEQRAYMLITFSGSLLLTHTFESISGS